MLFYNKIVTVAVTLALLITHILTLTQPDTIAPNTVSAAINSFSLKLLAKTSENSQGASNLALSPYTIWMLMAITNEGARNQTAEELRQVLGIPSCGQACQDNLRRSYRTLSSNLLSNEGVNDAILNLANGAFVDQTLQLNPEFEGVVRKVYDVNVTPIDFRDTQGAAWYINRYLAEKTGQLINDLVKADILQDTKMFLTSALYFRGFWQTPFDKTLTKKNTFFSENGKPLGEVDMMYLKSSLPLISIFDRKATAVELPYGDGDRISMIVVIPDSDAVLNEILALLADTPISKILEDLNKSPSGYAVICYLPRFTIKSDFVMNDVLESMGIKDVFSLRANLSGISPTKELFVKRVLQRAVIQVDEDGTTAAAVGGAASVFKSFPSVLRANRPFAYFIVDKPSQTVLFVGTVQNSNT